MSGEETLKQTDQRDVKLSGDDGVGLMFPKGPAVIAVSLTTLSTRPCARAFPSRCQPHRKRESWLKCEFILEGVRKGFAFREARQGHYAACVSRVQKAA